MVFYLAKLYPSFVVVVVNGTLPQYNIQISAIHCDHIPAAVHKRLVY